MAKSRTGIQPKTLLTVPKMVPMVSSRTACILSMTFRRSSSRSAKRIAAASSASLQAPGSLGAAARRKLSTTAFTSVRVVPVARSSASGMIVSHTYASSTMSARRGTRVNSLANGRQSPPLWEPSSLTCGARAVATASGVTALPTATKFSRTSSRASVKPPLSTILPAWANCQSEAVVAWSTASSAVRLPAIVTSSKRAASLKKARPSGERRNFAGRASSP
mmetsp:Transcript_134303/g.287266  ORF Transcript_134303/g.287266 Transcript_134303/m.287266 type:complete len:221 (-) Transcript_134303:85-747(-)